MLTTIRVLPRSMLAIMLATAVLSARAQEFPNKPIRIVSMYSAGGSGDIVTRVVAPEIAKSLGQPVIVETMLGASGLIATRSVAKQSQPDGHTLLVLASTVLTAPVFIKEVGVDFIRDLAPISIMAEGPLLLMTPMAAPWKDFNQMVAYAKANPGKLNTGVPSLQDGTYLFLQAVRQKFGLTFVDVPYKGGGTAYTQAIMVNEVQLAMTSEGGAAAGIANNTIRVLATTGSRRARSFPEIPTLEELGVPGVGNNLVMLFAPGATPTPVLDKLNAAVVKALQVPEIRDRIMKSAAYDVVASRREDFASALATNLKHYGDIARAAGIKPE